MPPDRQAPLLAGVAEPIPAQPEGRTMRDEALDRLAKRRAVWCYHAQSRARIIIRQHGYVTADILRHEYPVPADIDARVLGAVLNPRNFRPLGPTQTKRPGSHYRPIQMWGEK